MNTHPSNPELHLQWRFTEIIVKSSSGGIGRRVGLKIQSGE